LEPEVVYAHKFPPFEGEAPCGIKGHPVGVRKFSRSRIRNWPHFVRNPGFECHRAHQVTAIAPGAELKLHGGVTEVISMSIFQTLGLIWIILTSSLATLGLFYLAYVGLRAMLKKEPELPSEVKEVYRITGGR
jgi:hypothetical protein